MARNIKIKKLKGKENTYLIKECWLSQEDKYILWTVGGLILLAIIF